MAKENVVVIGGGPCGIEVARNLRDLGYTPILLEQQSELGGHLRLWDRLFPEGVEARKVLKELTGDLKGVKWFTDVNIESIQKSRKGYTVNVDTGMSFQTKALVVTTGFKLFPAENKQEYGYNIYERVITNADLEQYFHTRKDPRIQNPKTIGFVHCVGSRDEKACNRQCSKVCCATAVKQASEIKELFPDAIVYCFYMDLRLFGRSYEDMYLTAQRKYGVRFIRGRVSEVSEDIDGKLFVKAEDTLLGKPMKMKLDLLVLMTGILPGDSTKQLSEMLKIQTGEDGFFTPRDTILEPCMAKDGGLFMAGTCTGPKTIPETLSEARAAAIQVHKYLSK
ncbi:MAG: CoB--CoM heterodisulfide reductase iron-sulfur subunit A family protein [Bacteroidales bacterium]|nr:CoB--CoM heterodisulfide reductase iron-sulfur subunit A family protein [Bacteroidales bacterium]